MTDFDIDETPAESPKSSAKRRHTDRSKSPAVWEWDDRVNGLAENLVRGIKVDPEVDRRAVINQAAQRFVTAKKPIKNIVHWLRANLKRGAEDEFKLLHPELRKGRKHKPEEWVYLDEPEVGKDGEPMSKQIAVPKSALPKFDKIKVADFLYLGVTHLLDQDETEKVLEKMRMPF
jgi:hypothetical protein